MSSFENWLRILSMESIHFFEREAATVKKHFQKTCQFLFSVQNSSTLHRKRLEIASKIEKLDFYKLVKKCWQFHNSRHFTKSTTWVKTKPVFVGNLTCKAPHLYPLGLPVRLQGWERWPFYQETSFRILSKKASYLWVSSFLFHYSLSFNFNIEIEIIFWWVLFGICDFYIFIFQLSVFQFEQLTVDAEICSIKTLTLVNSEKLK